MENQPSASIWDHFLPDKTLVDPGAFAIPWDLLFEVLTLVIVLSFIAERVLATIFESRFFLNFSAQQKAKSNKAGDYKAPIAFFVSFVICIFWQIDILAALMSHATPSVLGALVTAGVIAGGSKASIKLFRDVLGVYSSEYAKAKGLVRSQSNQSTSASNNLNIRDASHSTNK